MITAPSLYSRRSAEETNLRDRPLFPVTTRGEICLTVGLTGHVH